MKKDVCHHCKKEIMNEVSNIHEQESNRDYHLTCWGQCGEAVWNDWEKPCSGCNRPQNALERVKKGKDTL